MVAYLDKLQKPNGCSITGRNFPSSGPGNGWVAGGMAELLSELPRNHPQRARILESYLKMMAFATEASGCGRDVASTD